MSDHTPLLRHPLHAASVFRAHDLMEAVRQARHLPDEPIPSICVLDCDGDLSDGLLRDGTAAPVRAWACFHTEMLGVTLDGVRCGVVPRTIGGPYAVLIAEQLHAAGAGVVICLTSAGRVSPALPLPCIVVADEAIRDEGTSLHYLPEGRAAACPAPELGDHLARELAQLSEVRRGCVWTTDAPYRETREQLQDWAADGVLAVEMQAASLFAFGHACGASVAVVALVSNSTDHTGEQFDTGEHAYRVGVLGGVVRAAATFLATAPRDSTSAHARRGARRNTVMDRHAHWNEVYTSKREAEVSWFQPVPSLSLEMLDDAGLTRDTCVIDVGGGESRLVDHLLARGLTCLAVLDVSGEALKRAQARLGDGARDVHWIEADVTGPWDARPVDIWHDRAVFHFLTAVEDRDRYRWHLMRTLKPGGTAVIATFALDGPEKCSGLPVARYSAETLGRELGAAFELRDASTHTHTTPWGTSQSFQYSRWQRTL